MAATLHFGQANRKAKMIGVHKMLFLLQDFRLQDASLSMSFKAGVGPPPDTSQLTLGCLLLGWDTIKYKNPRQRLWYGRVRVRQQH